MWRGPKKFAAIAVAGGVALTGLAGCGEASNSGFVACMVTDEGGVDDQSFNQSAWDGMKAAEKAESDVKSTVRESKDEKAYKKNLQSCLKDDKADLVVAVGGKLAEATSQVAKENKDKRFAIVDANLSDVESKNVVSMEFNAAQPSFLAGYAAAATSKTGKVGTFGGGKILPVTIFMDGYYEGVEYFNKQNKKDVKVLGWKENVKKSEAGKGSFVGDFENRSKGKDIAKGLISEGADIIFPVAGPAGIGGLEAAADDKDAHAIWVDIDGCKSTKYCDELLTTSAKNISDAVSDSVQTAFKDGDKHGRTVGTLENKGVELTKLGEMAGPDLKGELDKVKQQIIDGEIEIKSAAQPAPVKD